ncbi:unnamed protein product [Adineta steineri]|uniref:Uncharacterized protein n=1 Tax=Adineta steineri TaxID=433720 RepID=A0A819BHX4_9BILA|nr:unnamed protein product [Adineta steineri]CAF1497766.1 unnamed protein product [Adineta steineri]CAF3802409.1 unnamed protein product [Adineta steineri]CAF3807163.1 unnamed protein product [Adineta steineri]
MTDACSSASGSLVVVDPCCIRPAVQKVVNVKSNSVNATKNQVKTSQARSIDNNFQIQVPLHTGVLKVNSSQSKCCKNSNKVKSSKVASASDAVQVNNDWGLF